MAVLVIFDARTTISGGNNAVNTFHVRTPGLLSPGDVNAILAPFKTFFDAIAVDRPTGFTTTVGSRVLSADPTTWVLPSGTPGLPGFVPGHWGTAPTIEPATALTSVVGSGGTVGPAQLAIVVAWRTALAGPRYRGRTFVGPIGSTDSVNAVVPGAAVTRFNNAATALINGVAAATVTSGPAKLVVWSTKFGTTQEITSGSTDSVWDTMRSRVR